MAAAYPRAPRSSVVVLVVLVVLVVVVVLGLGGHARRVVGNVHRQALSRDRHGPHVPPTQEWQTWRSTEVRRVSELVDEGRERGDLRRREPAAVLQRVEVVLV